MSKFKVGERVRIAPHWFEECEKTNQGTWVAWANRWKHGNYIGVVEKVISPQAVTVDWRPHGGQSCEWYTPNLCKLSKETYGEV